MRKSELFELKQQIFQQCQEVLSAKAKEINSDIDQLRTAMANDSKSSMGDKYETSREMTQQAINQLEQQKANNTRQLFLLSNLNWTKEVKSIEKGSIIETNIGLFFIAISYGEMKVGDKSCFLISEVAPIGKLFLGKKESDEFLINNKRIEILNFV